MDLQELRYYSRWHAYANRQRYAAPADPWQHLGVDPRRITEHNQELRLNWGIGRVKGGEWDDPDACEPLEETTVYQGLGQRFNQGYDWEETALYQRAKAQFERGKSPRGYEDMVEYRSVRCEYLDELFRSIREEGYRSNATAAHDPATTGNQSETAAVHRLDPLVSVGRDGSIYLAEGFHRVCIASILGISEIPVLVLCRHEDWQQVRDDVATGSSTGRRVDAQEHPDLCRIH